MLVAFREFFHLEYGKFYVLVINVMQSFRYINKFNISVDRNQIISSRAEICIILSRISEKTTA